MNEIQKKIKDFMEQDVVVRKASYKGRGRPKKTDYMTIKRKQIPDFYAFQMFQNGFKVDYLLTNNQ